MGKAQESEWINAQKIVITQDLVAAAKQQLEFLAAVDRNRSLYEGPVLDKAIYRYKYFWLPLLAKHAECEVSEGPLVVPLDCEWVWHCHRLNPVQYKMDCVKLFGKILGCKNVLSSVTGACSKQSEAIWKKMYLNEPYELDMTESCIVSEAPLSTDYDLVSAVNRQSSFFYQVLRPNMKDDTYLEGAVARYKGFLYLIKRNKERNIRSFCVPLYDIDLIWHSHQLNPVSYCKDLVRAMGEVLEHDDTDSDRSKGKKLDVGFSRTTKQWEETFGLTYWRAGAMYRGNAPSPLSISLTQLKKTSKINTAPSYEYQDMVKLHKKMLVEVMLEIVEVRNLPAQHGGSIFVTFSKKQPDLDFNTRKRITINPSSREKQVAAFQCEPTGELVFQLMSDSGAEKSPKLLGSTSINLQDLLNPVQISVEKWFDFAPSSGFVADPKPISLRIAFSFTNPFPAPYVLLMVPTNPFSKKRQNDESWTSVVDEAGSEVIRIQMRQNSLGRKEVIGMTQAAETCVVAEFLESGWSLFMNHHLHHKKKSSDIDEQVLELSDIHKKMMIFPGRKLDYESKCCEKQDSDLNFMTAVEFSEEHPYGKAVALLNLKSGWIEIKEDWLVMPGILSGFILINENKKEMGNDVKENQIIINKETNKISTLKNLLFGCNGFSEIAMGTANNCNGGSNFSVIGDQCGYEHVAPAKDTGHAHCGGGGCSYGYEAPAKDTGHAHCGGGGGGCGGGCSGACAGRCGGGRCGGGRCGWGATSE